MRRLAKIVSTCTVTLSLLAGCRTVRDYPPVPVRLQTGGPSRGVAPIETSIHLINHETPDNQTQSRPTENILVLSGGGANGAFTAGMLVGWTQTGNRPEFDVVTGVSTGALIAPLAFLGADYDPALRHLFTSENASRIYKRLPLLPWSNALATSEPLRRQICGMVTERLLCRIASEHDRGRRLYVGTTNLDTQKLVVWDIGAIATSHHPDKVELVQEIILASCSVPGLLPPVSINVEIGHRKYSELHVDGGVSASMFLPPHILVMAPDGPMTSEHGSTEAVNRITVYTIVAGKADPDPLPVKLGLLNLSNASLAGMLRAQQGHELAQLYLMAHFANARFQLAAIPQSIRTQSSALDFDVGAMRALFNEGDRLGSSSAGWIDAPPGIDPQNWAVPRISTQLTPGEVSNTTLMLHR